MTILIWCNCLVAIVMHVAIFWWLTVVAEWLSQGLFFTRVCLSCANSLVAGFHVNRLPWLASQTDVPVLFITLSYRSRLMVMFGCFASFVGISPRLINEVLTKELFLVFIIYFLGYIHVYWDKDCTLFLPKWVSTAISGSNAEKL